MKQRLALLVLVATLATGPAMAQDDNPSTDIGGIGAHQAELDAVARDIVLTAERTAALQREIDALDKDRASLNRALVDGGREVQKLEGEIDATEQRLSALLADETRLRSSLAARRGVLAEVLAALQRLGHRPPPAILVRPEDALASIRSAILLGGIVPELRVAANALAADLRRLVAVREDVERERDRLVTNATALAEGRARTAMLIDERRRQQSISRDALAAEEQRAAVLAAQATSLKELIARLETENATAAAAAAEAEAAALANARSDDRPAQSLGSVDRLAPSVAFANARGLLPLPANGEQTIAFGGNDGLGGRSQGITLATRPGAQVSSPTDGWIVYSGPFRSYGQLLIINAGDGYHVLLAGMERLDVQLGQFVLAGEPVAAMAPQRLASAGATDMGAVQPVLYIEFRKDGASIDPAPWWAASNVEKVGG
jgi:septal ring factor EnvC (AmiA/AmiB activator)